MNCAAVRPRLPERTLGPQAPRDRAAVDRHLAVCAACRKEAHELEEAGAILAFAAAPVAPPGGLEDAVLAHVRTRARRRESGWRRWRFASAAAVVALAVALSGVWWGSVMARRPVPDLDRGEFAQERQRSAAEFARFIEQAVGADPDHRVRSVTLAASEADDRAGGWGFVLLAPEDDDFAAIEVINLDLDHGAGAPFLVALRDPAGGGVMVGKIRKLDGNGSGALLRRFRRDLSRYRVVVVRDAEGRVVLRGAVVTG